MVDHSDMRIRQLGLNLILQCTNERNALLSTLYGVNEAFITIREQLMLKDTVVRTEGKMLTELVEVHHEEARELDKNNKLAEETTTTTGGPPEEGQG